MAKKTKKRPARKLRKFVKKHGSAVAIGIATGIATNVITDSIGIRSKRIAKRSAKPAK